MKHKKCVFCNNTGLALGIDIAKLPNNIQIELNDENFKKYGKVYTCPEKCILKNKLN